MIAAQYDVDVNKTPWEFYPGEGPGFPCHIYCGIRLISTCFDHKAAERMVELHNKSLSRPPATHEQVEHARNCWGSDDIQIDADAVLSENEEGAGVFIQAWLWLEDNN